MRWLRVPGVGLLALMWLALVSWEVMALWIDGPRARWFAGALAAGLVLGSGWLTWRARRSRAARLGLALLLGSVLWWWLSLEPRLDRDWSPEYAQLPTAEIAGDRITFHNIRNFHYRSETDWDEHWETRSYDLARLRALDIFFSHWGSPYIAHTILTWEFEDGLPLAISIETRRERGETYSALLGFFRQFELYSVIADERDVIRLRTNFRGEQVFLYRLDVSQETARKLLLVYAKGMNQIAVQPRWYNAATHNCTTTIRLLVQAAGIPAPFDWRMLANGYLPELLQERGAIAARLPFEELRARSEVTQRGRDAGDAPDFSARIRAGLFEGL
jgi:hypothetical protein